MNQTEIQAAIESGDTVLGIELGSTRIKAVLIGADHKPIASGSHGWENQYVDGIWTYALDDVWTGLQESFRTLSEDVRARYGLPLKTVGAIGFSGMMHGHMAFDGEGKLLAPFRTWRSN
jgi:sugar (pentulose or hexulose) kinase